MVLKVFASLNYSMILCFVFEKCLLDFFVVSGNISVFYGMIQQLAMYWIIVINPSHIYEVT